MAEQSISLPVTPRSIESDAVYARRHSMGKPSSSASGEKVLPNYLRTSTGSCHDFCKYGRKHAFEEKGRRPFIKRNAKKPPDEQNLIELHPERNKASKVNYKPSPNIPPKTPEIIKREVSRKSLNRQTPVISKVISEAKTSSGVLLTKSADRQSPVLKEGPTKKKITSKEVFTKSFDSQSSVSSEIWGQKGKKSTQERKQKSTVELRNSPDLKTHLSPKVVKPDVSSSSGKLEVSTKQVLSKVKRDNLSAKGASSLKLKLSAPDSRVSSVSTIRGNANNKTGQRKLTSIIAAKRVQMMPGALQSPKSSSSGIARGLASPRISLTRRPSLSRVASLNARKKKGLELASALKNQKKIVKTENEHPKIKHDDLDQSIKVTNSDLVQEKTLYVVKMEAEKKHLDPVDKVNNFAESSPPPVLSAKSPTLPESPLLLSHNEEDEEESEYTVTESEDDLLSEYDETEYMEEAEIREGEQNWRHSKVGMVSSLDKNDQAVKLKFRRGRVIDIDTRDNCPRKLKFRRGRVLEDNQNFKAGARRSFKRRGAEGHANDGKPRSEKVVLRHQDVHGKKDGLVLFNNVIEETASKLAETRKSKVKALVGAFETVISLQDKKPTTNTFS
ncbi:hypothetical protein JCGZ_19907 [Jatropha curcas]|uniref:Calmodulin-binding domain-containing protein n=1 Tax=Jatropha curcas TaxID=180498 RepID=A0A067JWR7_JATCU|nr:uncharacterized protein LOC105644128 [Jatropha curcas]XP_012084782.1 uncharacterized protein LOC105644128 [Jatropha curcas]XP_020538891.1 uncharacterized protein LOC105644128 [Jatropha curcas]KDP27208.1 hypothetical protein JCGZ_19907 [Jatropha curcas]